jgi:pimeloyl-ACP methyl ester carboxylesterase
MTERIFAQRRAGEGRQLPYWEAGSGETIVAIADGEGLPTRAHELLAERRRVIVFAMTADAGTPEEVARRIGAAVAALGIERFDLMGEGAGAAAAMWLALTPEADIGSVVLAAPDRPPDEALRDDAPSARAFRDRGPIRRRRALSHTAARLPFHVRL